MVSFIEGIREGCDRYRRFEAGQHISFFEKHRKHSLHRRDGNPLMPSLAEGSQMPALASIYPVNGTGN